jgi:two-component system chemotaxis response regulator CheY
MPNGSTRLLKGHEAAAILLRRLAALGLKPGDAIPMSQVRARWQRTIYSFTELDLGIDYLLARKYVERREDPVEALFLTEQGFQALQNPPPRPADSQVAQQMRLRNQKQGKRPILLVEDDGAFRDALEEELTVAGYYVVTARDGQEALELLETIIHPGLVLLDLMLPRLNGWEVLDALQSDPRFANLPVAVVTAFSDRAPAGTVLFRKPLQLDSLLAFIAEHGGARA